MQPWSYHELLHALENQDMLNPDELHVGLGSTDVVVGYSQKFPNGTLRNFVETMTDSQWEEVVRSCEQTPKQNITVKFYKLMTNIP